MTGESETTTLGGGCFWCIEAVFKELAGVGKVQPGYSGGKGDDADYESVSSGKTGHAEVVQITYDPDVLTFREILEVFFEAHDPTTQDRQGADIGSQYRSVIFYHDEGQRRIAEDLVGELDASGRWESPVVTQVVPYEAFYPAEKYHEDYYENNPNQPYCRLVIEPKVSNVRKHFKEKLRAR